jgi:hypothetical protein
MTARESRLSLSGLPIQHDRSSKRQDPVVLLQGASQYSGRLGRLEILASLLQVRDDLVGFAR